MVGRRKGAGAMTPLELQMMQVLWAEGDCSVTDVQGRLAERGTELAYTTVQTMLNVLVRKGRAKRELEGRAYNYGAAVSRDSVLVGAVRDLVERMFGGSSEELVMSLIKSRQVDPERLAELGRRVAAGEEEKDA